MREAAHKKADQKVVKKERECVISGRREGVWNRTNEPAHITGEEKKVGLLFFFGGCGVSCIK